MHLSLIVKLVVLVFVALVTLCTIVFVVVDMFGRVDYLKDKFPDLERILVKRSSLPLLLLVCILLLMFNGYELALKEIPAVPELPNIVFPSPAVPPPIPVAIPRPRLIILGKNKPLDGKVFYLDTQHELNIPFPLQVKNVGNLATMRPVTMNVSLSEVVNMYGQTMWRNMSNGGSSDFPSVFETECEKPVIDAQDTCDFRALVGRKIMNWDKPVTVRIRAFYGAEKPAQATFHIEPPKPHPEPSQ
jgi:hypothetical protein